MGLKRSLGTGAAVFMGLGSIIGTGIFVSIGIAAGVAGYWVIPAIVIATFAATFNGLNSAQLAASHPVSGGTYAYGYRYLNPVMGFTAGWMFLVAKSASAATAALGFSGYFFYITGIGNGWMVTGGALLIVFLMGILVSGGITRSDRTNKIIVSITLLALGSFILAGLIFGQESINPISAALYESDQKGNWSLMMHAAALMFVAFTGYGRIATLGEEVREPRKTIPAAIITTLVFTMLLYVLTAWAALNLTGPDTLAESTDAIAAPLLAAASMLNFPHVSYIISVGALTAMLGVLLNLLLGISRVVLAMARENDLPGGLSEINEKNASPAKAVYFTMGIILILVASGNVYLTWSFSAFTVLVYYSITNLSALFLPDEDRLYPKIIAILGLALCLTLAFWVDFYIVFAGLGLIGAGLIWFYLRKRNG